jgi:Fe-S cluster assembly scaffold protein SufB
MPDNMTKLSTRLQARAEGTELSHEATVGKVGAEQLSYLMNRGVVAY